MRLSVIVITIRMQIIEIVIGHIQITMTGHTTDDQIILIREIKDRMDDKMTVIHQMMVDTTQ